MAKESLNSPKHQGLSLSVVWAIVDDVVVVFYAVGTFPRQS